MILAMLRTFGIFKIKFSYSKFFTKLTPNQFHSLKMFSNDCVFENRSKDSKPKIQKSTANEEEPFTQKKTLPSYTHLLEDSKLPFIDTHCHIDFLFSKLKYRQTFSDYMQENEANFPPNFEGCISIFCNPETFNQEYVWKDILSCSRVWGAFGCHPHHASRFNEKTQEYLKVAIKHEKVVALGEIGLDYSHKNSCDKDQQQHVFKTQLQIAVENDLPLVIHCREAFLDAFEIMKHNIPRNHLIHLHCFTSNWNEAKQWLNTFPNLFIGLTPVVTFESALQIHEVATKIPLEVLLLETDAPYFLPKHVPGGSKLKCSHPGFALHVAAQVAALKKVSLNEVLTKVRSNTQFLYNI